MTIQTTARTAAAIALGLLASGGAIFPMVAGRAAASPADATTALVRDKQAEKKRVLVLDFYYGNTGSRYWSGYSYSGSGAGVGISQQLIEALLDSGQVRVADRSVVADRDWGVVSTAQAIEAGKEAKVDYVIVGTVKEFNVETQSSGGSFMGIGGSSERKIAQVALGVKVIETATGDIIATATGEASRDASSGSGSVFGIGGRSSSSNDGALMSDAVEEAVLQLSEDLLSKL